MVEIYKEWEMTNASALCPKRRKKSEFWIEREKDEEMGMVAVILTREEVLSEYDM